MIAVATIVPLAPFSSRCACFYSVCKYRQLAFLNANCKRILPKSLSGLSDLGSAIASDTRVVICLEMVVALGVRSLAGLGLEAHPGLGIEAARVDYGCGV